ncbi:Ribosome biogenesis protein BMS1 homolog [Linum grandiflorum]
MAMNSGGKEQPHKSHRSSQAGASYKKKKPKDGGSKKRKREDGGASVETKEKSKPWTKADKLDTKKKRRLGEDSDLVEQKRQNPKAFAFSSGGKAKKLQSQAAEKEQRKLHIPTIDRTYGEPAPYVVVVQGPPKVGKSLLIKSLVKHYTKHNLPEVRGPISIVSGKKRRVQFVECPNDINGMIDAAKYADLALLLIDGSYGFEMETFEFLNILFVHGFPKIMGVLTHLDQFKDVKKLKKTKERLKRRFWAETYDGAKLFYLSGMIHGMYTKREVHNLARFISTKKFHPLSWRTSHPYVLVDRFEDVTPPEKVQMNSKCDRNVTLYGYLRGCNLKRDMKVHIAGVGDFSLAGVNALPDPCPLPSAAKKKGLRDKEKLFYGPMSGLGDLVYDKDAVYININDHFVQYSKPNDEGGETGKKQDVGEVLMKSLQNTKYSIDEKLRESFISLFSRDKTVTPGHESSTQDNNKNEDHMLKSEAVKQSDLADKAEPHGPSKSDAEDSDAEDSDGSASSGDSPAAPEKQAFTEQVEHHQGRLRRKAVFENDTDDVEEESDDDGDSKSQDGDASSLGSDSSEEDGDIEECDVDHMGNSSRWKESLMERTASRKRINLMQLVYGKSASLKESHVNQNQDPSDNEESDGDDFFKPKGEGKKKQNGQNDDYLDAEDCSKFLMHTGPKNWKEANIYENIRDRFVTGNWSNAAPRNKLSSGNTEDGSSDDDEDDVADGEFEDLETGKKYGSTQKAEQDDDDIAKEERRLKKLALRAKFDTH